MLKRTYTSLGVAAVIAVAAPCAAIAAGDNGVASMTASAIVAAASKAVTGVQSVHVAGAIGTSGGPITLDLDLAAGRGGKGTMSENGLSFQIIDTGKYVYIDASAGFWKHFGGNAAATLFAGRWLKSPAGGQFASLASLTNVSALFGSLLSADGALTKGTQTTVDGQPVIPLTDKVHGGTLYVATTGKPYPIEISKPGTDGGRIDFSKFGQSVSITAPAHSIDLSQLK